jgi:hypothetical protein
MPFKWDWRRRGKIFSSCVTTGIASGSNGLSLLRALKSCEIAATSGEIQIGRYGGLSRKLTFTFLHFYFVGVIVGRAPDDNEKSRALHMSYGNEVLGGTGAVTIMHLLPHEF